MELSEYTTEELRAELSRRYAALKEARQNEPRCRNCVHCRPNPTFPQFFQCVARTWGKKYVRNYCVKPYQKVCELYERKEEQK